MGWVRRGAWVGYGGEHRLDTEGSMGWVGRGAWGADGQEHGVGTGYGGEREGGCGEGERGTIDRVGGRGFRGIQW